MVANRTSHAEPRPGHDPTHHRRDLGWQAGRWGRRLPPNLPNIPKSYAN